MSSHIALEAHSYLKLSFATARGGLEASAAVTVAFCGIKYTGKLTSSCSAA